MSEPRRKRYGSYDRRGQLTDRIFIDERPSVVEMRQRISDWKSNTIIGRRDQGSLISLVERKSLYTLIESAQRKPLLLTMEKNLLNTGRWLKNLRPIFILPIHMPAGREDGMKIQLD